MIKAAVDVSNAEHKRSYPLNGSISENTGLTEKAPQPIANRGFVQTTRYIFRRIIRAPVRTGFSIILPVVLRLQSDGSIKRWCSVKAGVLYPAPLLRLFPLFPRLFLFGIQRRTGFLFGFCRGGFLRGARRGSVVRRD